ncbi:MAG: hydrolase [Betaproteobacteria bacterium]|nr:hydrolase [Betaproteobacteria bacterium]
MQLNHQEIDTPPRPAASVVLLRDGPRGLEVFLLKRHGDSDVLGGLYVFPGGKLDRDDSAAPTLQRLDTPVAALHQALGEPELEEHIAAGFFVAACRETFEESGVLFTQGADAVQAKEAAALMHGGLDFAQIIQRLDLTITASRIAPWSRWVTPRKPSLMNRRFDVRFFAAAVPGDQAASHDNYETTESVWLTPRAALEQYWDGQIGMAPPQLMSLAELSRHATAAEVLDPARRRWPRVILPNSFEHEEQRVLVYPGDERHETRERMMPGPTRLIHRNNRFEPLSGFEGFFA